MRVAMVLHTFAPDIGGAERQVQRLGPALERRGAEVTVLTRRRLPGHPDWPARERMDGLEVRRLPATGGPVLGPAAWMSSAVGALVGLRPDVIHAHHLGSPTSIALAAGALIGAPVVAKVLSAGPLGDTREVLGKPTGALRFAAAKRRVAAFVAVSGEVERELLAHGVPPGRIRRIPNGVDVGLFRPPVGRERSAIRARLGFAPDEFVALYLGRLHHRKRLDRLLQAWHDVPGRLVLVGSGPAEPGLRRFVADAGLDGRVRFMPSTDDPAPVYRAVDAYVSSSDTEGMSGSVLEAMASGLPVAALPAAGMDELLGGGAGVLATGHDAAALGAVLAALAADPARRARIGQIARARVTAEYGLEAAADRLTALYEELRREGARPSRTGRSAPARSGPARSGA